jgi:hypothetical protein
VDVICNVIQLLREPQLHDPVSASVGNEAFALFEQHRASFNDAARIETRKSAFAQFLRSIALVLHAAAACSIYGRRRPRDHHLQPPAQLWMTLPTPSLELATMRLWFVNNQQRLWVLRCCCMLSALAMRLSRRHDKQNSVYSIGDRRIARDVVRRCLTAVATRLWQANVHWK